MQNNNIVLGLQAFQRGQQARDAGRLAQAAQEFNRALALMPDHPKVLAEFAQLADAVSDWKAAATLYEKLGRVRPQSGYEPFLGRALFHLERFAEAVPLLQAHLARHPDDAEVTHALANSLCSTGRWEEGLVQAEHAFALRPDAKRLDAVLNTLFHLGRDAELGPRVDEALRRYPDSPEIRSMYALHHLKARDYADGFARFADLRWRNNLKAPADGGTPGQWWDGERFDGTLLVTAEQGLGDEIMVSSLFADLVALGQPALIECDARLLPLYERSFPSLRFVPRHQRRLQEAFAAGGNFRKVNGLDLARFFRRDAASFPPRGGWLQPDPARVAALRADYAQRWPQQRRIGLSWKSSRVMEGGASKNVALADFAALLALPGTAFVNLQYGDVAADIAAVRNAGLGEIFIDGHIDSTADIDGLCAQVAALDLVVSTSNTTVHIAGALDVPCLVLLPRTRPVLWYWGYRGERTPWYPSLRLLRNSREDDWQDLLAGVAAGIAAGELP